VSLDRLRPGDQLTLTFEQQGFGAPMDLPEQATVEVLPEGREFEPDAGEIRVDCLGPNALPDRADLYLQVRESAYAATRVKVAVAYRMGGWQLAPVRKISRASRQASVGQRQPVV
jgi:hypothetical protein